MKSKILTFSILAISIFSLNNANAQATTSMQVSANVIPGCNFSANDVHFVFSGLENFKTSIPMQQSAGRSETVWENTKTLTIDTQCSKGTQIQLYHNNTMYNNVGWIQLFHTDVQNVGQPLLVIFPLINTSNNITVHSNPEKVLKNDKLTFTFNSGEQGSIIFSGEIDHNIGQEFSFVPGKYAIDLNLAMDF